MLVDVMYQFLFCFWFPPFIVFNTELVYNVNHYVVLPFTKDELKWQLRPEATFWLHLCSPWYSER